MFPYEHESHDSNSGAAPVHRDPRSRFYRLRKIQCISQRTWNGLSVVASVAGEASGRRALGPWGPRAARAKKKFARQNYNVDSGVPPQVKQGVLYEPVFRRPPPNLTTP